MQKGRKRMSTSIRGLMKNKKNKKEPRWMSQPNQFHSNVVHRLTNHCHQQHGTLTMHIIIITNKYTCT